MCLKIEGRYNLLLAMLMWMSSSIAQTPFPSPASVQALGNSGVSMDFPETFSINPAASSSPVFFAGVTYSDRYLLKDLSSRSAFFSVPVIGSNLLLSLGQFGNQSYQENQISFGLARSFGDHLSVGMLFHYVSLKMEEAVSRPNQVSFSLGFQYKSDDYGVGLSVFNPLSQSLSAKDFHRSYPFIYRFGLHKYFHTDLLVAGQLSFHEEYNFVTHWGIQYRLLNCWFLRAGLQTKLTEMSFGFGYVLHRIHADLTFSHHEYLGFSPALTIYYR